MRANSVACLADAPVNRADGAQSTVLTGHTVDVCLALRGAIEGVGCPHKVAAAEAGYQPDYWSRVLHGERGISLDRLGALPRDVQVAFLSAWATQLGIRIERRGDRGDRFAPDLAELITQRRVRITLESIEP